MKILVSQIDPNPHRDLARNPVSEEQVTKLIDSIGETGLWNGLLARPYPEHEGRYQLAFGHNRIEACRRLGITEVTLQIQDLSDYGMFSLMITENATQQGILPPRVVFENIVAAIRLLERLLSSTTTVEEFNKLLEFQIRPVQDESPKWSKIQYGRAKSAISETGDGLGKDFVKRIMPKGTCPNNETLQNTIDSFYRERRQVAAERRARAAEEARRAALVEKEALEEQAKLASEREEAAKREVEEAERKERAAADLAEKAEDEKTKQAALRMIDKQRAIRQKAVKRAGQNTDQKRKFEEAIGQTQQKIAEETKRADFEKVKAEKFARRVIDQDLLQQLDSTSKMDDVVRLVKRCHIPPAFHAELIEHAKGWAADSPASLKTGTSITIRGESWWDITSGNYAERMQKIKDQLKEQDLRDKLGTKPLPTVISNLLIDIGRTSNDMDEPLEQLKLASEYFSTLKPKELRGFRDRMERIHHSVLGQANVLLLLLRSIGTVLRAQEREINPSHEPLQIEVQRDAVLAEMDEPMDGIILLIDETNATASTSPRIEGR